MKKKISALLLSVVLCLSLAVNALAVGEAVKIGDLKAGDTAVNITGLEANKEYLACSIGKNGVNVKVFNLTADKDGSAKIELADALAANDKIAVYIPGATSDDVTATVKSTSTSGGGGGGGGGGGNVSTHPVRVSSVANGSVSVSPSNAAKGEKVTITVKPNKGYVLDAITVKDANGNVITLTKVNDTTYTFLMPNTSVTVDATFKPEDGEAAVSFSDVASDYTFYNDIMWVASKGFMQGYDDGTFKPNNNTTRQALWMVLARIDGANPSSMTAARTWAMNSNVSDGTNPTNPMSRQQMVTMLYRYAQLKGYPVTGGVSIAGYPDAANVASYAQEAMSWAVGNGIVQGTTSGQLNPTGTASRAHFAAFLHRFCTTAGIA